MKSGPLVIPKNPGGKTRIVTTRSHIDNLIKRDLTSIPNSELIHAGGAGYKVLTVIDGTSDCYLYPKDGTKRWDTCAPEALIRCMNGTMTDIFGNEYSYQIKENDVVENCYGVVFSLNESNSEYVKYLSDELKDKVRTDAEKLKAKKSKN